MIFAGGFIYGTESKKVGWYANGTGIWSGNEWWGNESFFKTFRHGKKAGDWGGENRSVQEGDESSDTGYCKDVKGSNERSLGNNEIKKIIEDYLPEEGL